MIGAVDADILTYELSYAAEAFWKGWHKEKGEEPVGPPPFDVIMGMVEERIPYILEKAGVSESEFYFSGDHNFRNFIAITRPYKENRPPRPFHYKNTKAYLKSEFKWFAVEGLEADDLISLRMRKSPGKYICITRDKDLRQNPGWHYGWETHNQAAFGPYEYDEFGEIQLSPKRDKVIGGGRKFFYAQLLTGDSTDTIPGIPKLGPVKAYNLLKDAKDIGECEFICSEAYKRSYGLYWNQVMREQGRLLNLAQDVDKEGNVLLWSPIGEPDLWINYRTGECFEKD